MRISCILMCGCAVTLLLSAGVSLSDEGQPAGGTATPPPSYSQQVKIKLTRAVTNMGRAGSEFYVQPRQAKRETGKTSAMFWPGIGEGFGMCLTRVSGGLIELVTCAVPFPNGWQPILDE